AWRRAHRHAVGGDETLQSRDRLSGDPGLQLVQHAADVFATDRAVRDRDRRQRADRPPRRPRRDQAGLIRGFVTVVAIFLPVVPAKAGTHRATKSCAEIWIPAFAGMTR